MPRQGLTQPPTAGGSGGSSPDSWIQVGYYNADPLEDSAEFLVPWTDAHNPPARGSDIQIDGDSNTVINILATGKYDVTWMLNIIGGTESSTISAYIIYNDDSTGPFNYWQPQTAIPAGSTGGLSQALPKVALTAGDTLKLHVVQSGGSSNDVLLAAAVMAIARVA